MNSHIDSFEDAPNPLDRVEEILSDNNWVYNRMNDMELMVKISGKSCEYRLIFVWEENMSALKFCCQYDLAINRRNIQNAGIALMDMNADLWMGHFEIARDTMVPVFRHTCLLRGHGERSGFESIQDLVDISLVQCERFRHVFHLLSEDTIADVQTLSLAMMDTQGES
jgi:hypothetical protein